MRLDDVAGVPDLEYIARHIIGPLSAQETRVRLMCERGGEQCLAGVTSISCASSASASMPNTPASPTRRSPASSIPRRVRPRRQTHATSCDAV